MSNYAETYRQMSVFYNTSTKQLAVKMLVTSELGLKIKESRITFSRRKFEEFKINWKLGLQVSINVKRCSRKLL